MRTRRELLGLCSALPLLGKSAKITGVHALMLQGPRTYTLIRVMTDQGVDGIGESWGSPATGIKEGVLELKSELIGRDPLEIEAIADSLRPRLRASEHTLVRSLAGIEMALWDCAGKLLGVPVSTLLGGRKRDRVRMVHNEGPRDMLRQDSCREWSDKMRTHPAHFTAFRFPFDRPRPLSPRDIRELGMGYDNCRAAIGSDYGLIVECAGDFDVATAVAVAAAVEGVKPMFVADPLPGVYTEGWKRLCAETKSSIGAGAGLNRHAFRDFTVNHGCDVIEPDVRSVGLVDAKKIADLAELASISVAARNGGTPVSTMATVHWASTVRDFLGAETVVGLGNWMDDLIVRDGPIVKDGHIAVPVKPGLGIELNKEVAKANLARGEKWWD